MVRWRKTISYMLFVLLCICYAAAFPLTNVSAFGETYFEDDFETGYTDGDILKNVSGKHAADQTYTGSDKWSNVFGDAEKGVKIIKEPGTNNKVMNFWSVPGGTATRYPFAYKMIPNGANKKIALDFRLKTNGGTTYVDIKNENTGSLYNVIYFSSNNIKKYDNSATQVQVGTFDTAAWADYTVIVDVNAWTVNAYMNGQFLFSGTPSATNPSLAFNNTLFSFKTAFSTSYIGNVYIDNIKFRDCSDVHFQYKINNTMPINIQDKLSVDFGLRPATGSAVPQNISVKDSEGNNIGIESVTMDVYKADRGEIKFINSLEYGTAYQVTMPGVTDIIGRSTEQSVNFTTRPAVFTAKEPKLYSGTISEEHIINALTTGTLVGAVEFINEKKLSYTATMMMILYDNDGTIKDIACTKDTILPQSTNTISAQMSTTDVLGCKLKILVWDNLEDLNMLVDPKQYSTQ